MPAPIVKKAAAQPHDSSEADLIDRTMEVDMRWLQYEKNDDSEPAEPRSTSDDPTVVLDLTATQVHDLLSAKRK